MKKRSNKRYSRLISLLLAVVMVMGLIPTIALAETAPTDPKETEPIVSETSEDETVPETSEDETVPETSEPASEPTVPESSTPASDPMAPESSTPASDPMAPESSGPAAGPNEPVQVDEPAGPAVGDKIYIKSGSLTYKAPDENSVSREVWWNYETKIVSIVTDATGAAAWYEFEPTGLLDLPIFRDYKYVKAENTTITDPDATVPTEPDVTDPTEPDVTDPTEPEEEPGSDKKVTVGETDVVVTGAPEGVSLTANTVNKDQYNSKIYDFIDKNSELLFAYDITLTNENGSVWQPAEGKLATVTLDFNGAGLPDGNKIKILHDHNGELKELGAYEIKDGKLSFTTDGFSDFYFYITYSFGGYTFVMSGEDEVYLSNIMSELGISRKVSEVAEVKFTNEECIEITREGSDWLLKSIKPFGTEETLTIIFNDGESIEISVKDPAIFNYAVGSDITNFTKLPTEERTVQAESKTFLVNSNKITVDDVVKAGAAEKTAGTNPAPDTVHMIIYATEGMAIDFNRGTGWNEPGSKPKPGDDEIWYWSWESSANANYVVVKDGSAGKQAKFCVTTTSDGIKYYCNVVLCVVEKSNPVLLETALQSSGLDGMTIRNVPVTLYDYDGKTWNEYYNAQDGHYIAFSGTVNGVNTTTNADKRGWTTKNLQANGGGSHALMGIMQDTLVNGLPVASQGQKVDLFSTKAVPGKTVYEDVDFQFVYNESTGYYTYNSALNHAQYNNTTKQIQLYEQSLAQSDTPNGSTHGNAGFYPFADINKAYTNTGYEGIDWKTWQEKLENNAFELIPSKYSTDIVTAGSTNPASTAELHYGIQVNSDFYLPKGKQLNGKDMIYEFTGDDDLWVYIDGKLVLDIGGGHTAVSGSFNLTTGKVWVEEYTKLAAADGGYYQTREQGVDLRYTDNFLTGLADDAMHTIQIFYLERHGGVSNCRMRFNLPLIPSNSVTVGKELLNHKGEGDFAVTPDTSYTFAVYSAEDNTHDVTNDDTQYKPLVNTSYEVVGGGSGKTGADGKFTLKDGQFVTFTDIPLFTDIYVVEFAPNDEYSYSTPKVSINNSDLTEYAYGTPTTKYDMALNQSYKFAFTNYMNVTDLRITKDLTDPYDRVTDDTAYKMTVKLNDVPYAGTAELAEENKTLEDGTFALHDGESLVIRNIPVNMTFSVVETDPIAPDGYSYATQTYAINGGTASENVPDNVKLEQNVEVIVYNELKALNGHLTIKKSGIDSLDHPVGSTTNSLNKQEQQSTVYVITGTPDSGDTFDPLEVVIVGNASITVHDLPVGTYTVTEKENWSWRYDADDAQKQAVITGDTTTEVGFVNTRTNPYWLSGDNYKLNLFNKKTTE